MYNESIKVSFVQSSSRSKSNIEKYKRIFDESEVFESTHNKDLCEFNKDELSELMPKLSSIRSSDQHYIMSFIKKYAHWCRNNTSLNVGNDIFEFNSKNLDKFKNSMVSGPKDLQKFLDEFLQPPENKSHEDVFRGYLWLGFMGFKRDKTVELKTEDVDFVRNAIKNGDKWVTMYDESYSAFYNLATLKSFNMYNSFYKYVKCISFDRDDNDLLLRIKKGDKFNAKYLQNQLSKLETVAEKKLLISRRLSFERAALSGIFYRKYQDELKIKKSETLNGEIYKPDFTEEALNSISDVSFDTKQKYYLATYRARKGYERDYEIWKEAFDLE